MMNVEGIIEKYQLNETEAQVLRFMQQHKSELKTIGIRQVAKANFVSTASIVNLSKKIGFSGYSELTYAFLNVSSNIAIPESVTSKEAADFIELLSAYKEKNIMILANGFSQNLANYFSEALNLYGFRATANSHLEFLRETVGEDLLLMVISNSGQTQRTIELVQTAVTHGIKVIAFVGDRNSQIGRLADLTIATQTYSPTNFTDFAPQLFFGTTLNQFEILFSQTLHSLFK